jgi:hypothetical protein
VRVRNSRFTGVPADVSDGVFTIQENLGLQLVSPNGSEMMESGKHFTLRWLKGSGINIENVKLEYSPDNGTTYLPIAEAVPNTGTYEWFVPYHASPHCLVRISSADDNKTAEF